MADEDERQPVGEPSPQPFDDPAVEEDPRRQRVGEDEPDASAGSREPAARPRSARERGAVEAVKSQSLGWRAAGRPAFDAEDVHAGGPQQPAARARAAACRRVRPRGRGHRATKTAANGATAIREPVGVDAVEPRHAPRPGRRDAVPRAARPRSAPRGAYRPVREEEPVAALAQRRVPRPDADARRRARSAAARGRSRAGSRRSVGVLDRPAHGARASPRVRRVDDVTPGAPRAARCRGGSGATCPGPAGISPA